MGQAFTIGVLTLDKSMNSYSVYLFRVASQDTGQPVMLCVATSDKWQINGELCAVVYVCVGREKELLEILISLLGCVILCMNCRLRSFLFAQRGRSILRCWSTS